MWNYSLGNNSFLVTYDLTNENLKYFMVIMGQ